MDTSGLFGPTSIQHIITIWMEPKCRKIGWYSAGAKFEAGIQYIARSSTV